MSTSKVQKEIYKDIPGYENIYQVSNLGNVKSLKYNKERILKSSINSRGYYLVVLVLDKKIKSFTVHKLLSITFLNDRQDNKLVVDHINGIKTDNRLENLQLVTQRTNVSKDVKNKTSKYTGVHWNNKTSQWRSRITIKGKSIHLGMFEDEFEASESYQKALSLL